MPLEPGTCLGPYEITALIGAGGMGEVYKGRDTRLDRVIAIKVAKAEFSERFQQEAKAVAALSHPHICTLHDVGPNYLVMEFIDGAPLKGPLPLDTALRYAVQIADALDAAHSKGITHRDLKPANIMVTKSSGVKLLDFGLARIAKTQVSDETLTMALTNPGTVIGTFQYMAPEQLEAKETDGRTDIFAFGAVLYEMLTGRRAFEGKTQASLIAAILERPAPSIADVAPPALDRVLKTCLAKDPEDRWQTARDLKRQLQWIDAQAAAPTTSAIAPAPAPTRQSGNKYLYAAVAILAVALAAALWAPWRAEPERPLVRLDVDLGADVVLPAASLAEHVVLSPDGTRLVYVASVAGGPSRLYMRRLNEEKAVELPGSEGVVTAAFSPDGKSLAFIAGSRIYKMSAEGGAATRIAEIDTGNALAWAEDGSIVFGGIGAGLRRIPSTGGEPVKVTELANGEVIHAQPKILPGGKTVLFAAGWPNKDFTTVDAVSITGAGRKTVVPNGTAPHYLASGHLLYVSRGTLFAIRFDPDKLETQGDAVPVATDIKATFSGSVPVSNFSAAGNGTLVYRRGSGPIGAPGPSTGRSSTVEWIDTTGKRSPLIRTVGAYYDPHVSPDGNQVALTTIPQSGPGVAVYDVRRDIMTPLSFDGVSVDPAWSHDGRYLVFVSVGPNRGLGRIVWLRASSGGQPQTLIQEGGATGSFAPDGKRLAYLVRTSSNSKGTGLGGRIFTATITEENSNLKAGMPEPYSPPQFNEFSPQFSPDGRWIAFRTDKSGRNEVVVRAFPLPASGQAYEVQISSNGGTNPRWSRTGKELLYQEGDRVMAARYTLNGDTFVPDRPRVRVEKLGGTEWDLAPDGRIAVVTPVENQQGAAAPAGEHHVVFLQNFFDELKRRLK